METAWHSVLVIETIVLTLYVWDVALPVRLMSRGFNFYFDPRCFLSSYNVYHMPLHKKEIGLSGFITYGASGLD
jgi:hypothetical protein